MQRQLDSRSGPECFVSRRPECLKSSWKYSQQNDQSLRNARRPFFPGRQGGVLPFLLILIIICLGMAAIAVDISRMYLVRTQLQIAADAGALAGAQRVMAGNIPSGFDSATVYASLNLTENESPDVANSDVLLGSWNNGVFTPAGSWMDPSANAVRVTTRHTADYIFGRIYGQTTRSISATAVAAVGSVGSASCIRPFAVPYEMLLNVLYPTNTPSVSYNLTASDIARLSNLTQADKIGLKVGSNANSPISGNFYAIREGPIVYADGSSGNPWSGASYYRDAISASCSSLVPIVGVGDWLQAEQGNMLDPTRDGIAALCGFPGSAQSFNCQSPVRVYIPIWDVSNKNVSSPNAFRVKYIGVFMVTGFNKNDGVLGYFSSMGGTGGSFSPRPGPIKKIALVK